MLRNSLKPSSASPSRPLTKIRSPARAPERSTALPARTSPSTVTLIKIRSCRVVSPPAAAHPNRRAARCNPPRNSSSHRPVCVFGTARLSRKHRGSPPIAAMSLAARARHFQPTASAGCNSRRKCVPSKNQSHVRIVSYPFRAANRAASSPIPSRSRLSLLPPPRAKARAILRSRLSSPRASAERFLCVLRPIVCGQV